MSEEQKQERKNRVSVNNETFIEVWVKHQKNGGGIAEIARELDMAPGSVNAKATTLRREYGIPLPQLTRGSSGGRKSVDRGSMLAKLAELTGEKPEKLKAIGDKDVAETKERKAHREAEKAAQEASQFNGNV